MLLLPPKVPFQFLKFFTVLESIKFGKYHPVSKIPNSCFFLLSNKSCLFEVGLPGFLASFNSSNSWSSLSMYACKNCFNSSTVKISLSRYSALSTMSCINLIHINSFDLLSICSSFFFRIDTSLKVALFNCLNFRPFGWMFLFFALFWILPKLLDIGISGSCSKGLLLQLLS